MYARPMTRDLDYQLLIRRSYGRPAPVRRARRALAVTTTTDSGAEVLPQPDGSTSAEPEFVEYVVERDQTAQGPTTGGRGGSTTPGATADPAPVTATPAAPAAPAPTSEGAPGMPAPATSTAPATRGTGPSAGPTASESAPPVAAPEVTTPALVPGPAPAPGLATPRDTAAAPSSPERAGGSPTGSTSDPVQTVASSPLTPADLAADMQRILRSELPEPSQSAPQSVPAAPQTVPAAPQNVPTPPANGRPMPEAPNQQAIFDRIAQSMEHANSFDLGTVNLNLARRFDEFERDDGVRRQAVPTLSAPQTATAGPLSAAAGPPPATDTPTELPAASRLLPDLPAERLDGVSLAGGCALGHLSATAGPERSRPMYDTGEHVLAGNNLYPDQLRAGSGSGVAFSYGQIIAMGDFYETVDDMLNAAPAELSQLKSLIEKSAAHYRGGTADVTSKQWNDATGGRYLTLADDNFTHFAPPSTLGMTESTSHPDHRSTWERYHERAIQAMRGLVADHPSSSVAPFGPLTINAFGDHFLTDAFASGHLVNKDVVMARVGAAFFSGSQLTRAGQGFLARLAHECWGRRKVRDTFSSLELVETIALIHWNIDTENAFRKLLVGIAEKKPTMVQNLAVKAVHDHLNSAGVEVTNDAGDGWTLKGDIHLDDSETLPIMQRAVQQSIDNILDPSILASQAAEGPLTPSGHPQLLAKVWKHVPQPTASGRRQVLDAITTYTDLSSSALLADAADLVTDASPLIAAELITKNILRHE